jgi:hypothetical protein
MIIVVILCFHHQSDCNTTARQLPALHRKLWAYQKKNSFIFTTFFFSVHSGAYFQKYGGILKATLQNYDFGSK